MKKRNMTQKEINAISPAANVLITVILVLIAAIFVWPVLLVFSISLSSEASIVEYGFRFFPKEFSLEAYRYLIHLGKGFWRSYGNTIFYSTAGTIFGLFVMSMYAYVISRKEFEDRNKFAFFAFFTTLFSGGLVPDYILYCRYLHINNTIWVFLLPSLVNAFYVIILRTFITTTIDDAMLESARLDGANEWQNFIRIVLPLSKPGLASVGLFTFVEKWNDWFIGLTYVNKAELQPVMTFLQKIQNNLDFLKSGAPEALTPDAMEMLAKLPTSSARMAITVCAILPLLCCYPFFQKYFIKGLTIGSVKG